MSWPRPDCRHRWLFPAALLLAAPKCVLCVLAYAGLATGLGLGGPELCGGTRTDWLFWLAVAGGGVLLARLVFYRAPRP